MDEEQSNHVALYGSEGLSDGNGHAPQLPPEGVAEPTVSTGPVEDLPLASPESTVALPRLAAAPVAPPAEHAPEVRRVQKRRLNPALLEGPDVIVIRRSTLYGGIFIAVVFFALGLLVGRFIVPDTSRADVGSVAEADGELAGVLGVKADEPSWGPADARITIVEYSDFQCPYCKMFYENTYIRLRQRYGDQVRFVFRDFPLDSIHPQARPAAEAAQCAHEQGKFWEYHDVIFANQQALQPQDLKRYAQQLGLDTEKFNNCVDTRKYQASVEADFQDGVRRNVTGTPTFFINGQVLVGAQPFESFQTLIDQFAGAGD